MTTNQTGSQPETASRSAAQMPSAMPLWLSLSIVIGGFLMALGGFIALLNPSMLIAPNDQITHGLKVYAGYFAVRNLVLGFFLPTLLALGARRTLGSMMVIVGFIQLVDAIMDCVESRWAIVPGVLLLAALYLIGANRTAGAPFWRREFWI